MATPAIPSAPGVEGITLSSISSMTLSPTTTPRPTLSPAAPSQPIVLPDLNATLGAVFVGFAVSCVVYGIFVTQTMAYFSRYPFDRSYIKFLVIVILLLESADQAFIGHISYFYSVQNWGKPKVLLQATETWSFILQLTVGAVVGAIVKASFGIRVWRFSERNIWITGLIMILTVAQLALAMTFAVKAFQLPNVFAVIHLQLLGTVSLATGVLTDIVTAIALSYFVNRLRTGYKQSDSLVNELMRYAVSTGALTGAVSITVLVLYNVMPDKNLYFIAVYFLLSKLYAISYMATLNTRRTIKGRGTDRQGATANGTNMFHLGTRMPSLGPGDFERMQANEQYEPPSHAKDMSYRYAEHLHPEKDNYRVAYAV